MLIATSIFELLQGYHFIGSVHGSSAGGNTIEDTEDTGGQAQPWWTPSALPAWGHTQCQMLLCTPWATRSESSLGVMGHDQGHASCKDILFIQCRCTVCSAEVVQFRTQCTTSFGRVLQLLEMATWRIQAVHVHSTEPSESKPTPTIGVSHLLTPRTIFSITWSRRQKPQSLDQAKIWAKSGCWCLTA